VNQINAKRKKFVSNLVGAGILVLWLIMISGLIIRTNFNCQIDDIKFAGKSVMVDSPQDTWMEIYLKNKKAGYSVNQITPVEKDYLIRDEIFLKTNLAGHATVIHTVTRAVTDDQFILKTFKFRMTSGVATFHVSGKVEGNTLNVETGEGRNRRNTSIKLSGPVVIGAGIAHFFKNRPIEVGNIIGFSFFDPSTLSQKEMVFKVAARESIAINNVKYEAFRLETEIWGQVLAFWLDERGSVLKEQGFMGLTSIRSDSTRAASDISGSEDFYRLAAVNVNGRLHNPYGITYLKLKVTGLNGVLTDKSILNSGRQRFSSTGILEIFKESLPAKSSYLIPYQDHTGSMKYVLEPELLIESDATAIMEKAQRIARDVRNPVIVARRLLGWVYTNLEKRPLVTVPSALEVLRTKVGDCNEHATLLTALLRSSGIPSRICVGLVYARGKFLYHAWTEAFIGTLEGPGQTETAAQMAHKNCGWVSMDPTLNQMPVDATHIKLVQGGLHKQVEIIGLMGRLELRVIDYAYD
jgi:hypothetical protein